MSTAKATAPGDLFKHHFEALSATAEKAHQAAIGNGFTDWHVPVTDEWDGNLLDSAGIGKAFSRDQHIDEFNQSVADSESGTVGDLIASQLQGDTLAAMERAFRSRHRSSVRNKMHAAARMRGHGHKNGTVKLGMLNYIERIIKQAGN